MLDALIVILSFYGLTQAIRDASILALPRNWIMRKSVFFFKLLSCSFCMGFHSGWIVYLIHESIWSLKELFLWGLASAAASYIITIIMNKLAVENFN